MSLSDSGSTEIKENERKEKDEELHPGKVPDWSRNWGCCYLKGNHEFFQLMSKNDVWFMFKSVRSNEIIL